MSDHPVLIPTSEGAVGGIVSEPAGEPRGALLLLAGAGRPARSGVNAFWTRLSRSLARQGIVVLRADYAREGETLPIGQGGSGLAWKIDLDTRLMTQVVAWFRQKVPNVPLLLAGLCEGARLAIHLAGTEPKGFAGSFLIVPYLRDLQAVEKPIDPAVVEYFQAILAEAPSWILVGEEDKVDTPKLKQLLGPTAHELEIETVPTLALHLLDQPDSQNEVARRLPTRITAA